MKRLVLIAALLGGCETWAAHPVSISAAVGGFAVVGGATLIDDAHPVAGGAVVGAAIGATAVAIVLGLIIDNFNDSHRGARVCAPVGKP